jgi:hypothetical protein
MAQTPFRDEGKESRCDGLVINLWFSGLDGKASQPAREMEKGLGEGQPFQQFVADPNVLTMTEKRRIDPAGFELLQES